MYQKQIAELIQLLEQVKRRPGMYIGYINHFSLSNYLFGIYTGLRFFGLDAYQDKLLQEITQERGWRTDSSAGAYPFMKEAGLSEEQIVEEDLAIHIEMWHRRYRSLVGDNPA